MNSNIVYEQVAQDIFYTRVKEHNKKFLLLFINKYLIENKNKNLKNNNITPYIHSIKNNLFFLCISLKPQVAQVNSTEKVRGNF